jgi:large subunit ribosomal protein L25
MVKAAKGAKAEHAAQQELTVQRRTIVGTRRVNRMRGEGLIPGIVYGRTTEPMAVTVNRRAFAKVLHSKSGEHALVTLKLEEPPGAGRAGGKAWQQPALVKTVQHHPVDGHVVHVDFQAIVLTERIRVKVPVVLKGESIGVKQEGGLLEHFLRELEVECLPTEIPASIEFDVSALKIGDTVHVKDVVPPQNTKILSDAEGVIASVHLPKVEKAEEAAEAAVTEPEVLREKKEEGEAAAPAGEAKGEKTEKTEKTEKKDAKT